MPGRARSKQKASLLATIIKIVGLVVLLILVVVGLIVGVSFWAGWQDLNDFSRAIKIAGILLIGVGLLGVKGDLEPGSDGQAKSPDRQDNQAGIQESLGEYVRGHVFMLVNFTAGLMGLIIGWLL